MRFLSFSEHGEKNRPFAEISVMTAETGWSAAADAARTQIYAMMAVQ
jgi:hypothetical protein